MANKNYNFPVPAVKLFVPFNGRIITIHGLKTVGDLNVINYCNAAITTIDHYSGQTCTKLEAMATSEDKDLRDKAKYYLKLYDGVVKTLVDLFTTENLNYSSDEIVANSAEEQMNIEHLYEMLRDLDEAAHQLADYEGVYEKMLIMLQHLGIISKDTYEWMKVMCHD
jgi:hypothetical protein